MVRNQPPIFLQQIKGKGKILNLFCNLLAKQYHLGIIFKFILEHFWNRNAMAASALRRIAGSRIGFRRLSDRPMFKTAMCNYRQKSLKHSSTVKNTLENL